MGMNDEAISNECIDNLIINVIKSIQNMKKLPDCSCTCDYLSKLLSNSDITEEIILNRLHYVTDNNNDKSKPTNGREFYYTIDEMSVQVEILANPSNELIQAL